MSGEFAGRLGERLEVERRGAARDPLGGDGAWLPQGRCRAMLVPAGEVAPGAAAPGANRWRATVRPLDVRPGDRLRWRGRVLAVERVLADPATPDRMRLDLREVPA